MTIMSGLPSTIKERVSTGVLPVTQTVIGRERRRSGWHLFLLSVPFLVLVFLFSYLPLFGWSYAFVNYRAGLRIREMEFVGFSHFTSLVANPIVREDILRVMRNTFAMSFLGLATSPLPMIFAIFLAEIRHDAPRRLIQTLSTLPNFISWVLVYSVAWSIFSVGDGFLNKFLLQIGLIDSPINFLASPDGVWLKMMGYGIWKGLGWGAILYLAALAAIDPQLYEAAVVDGAGRFKRMWYITVPGLLPTYFVLLLISIANFLNHGFEQYFVFQNAMTKPRIEVLDLYVYNQGLAGRNISYATVVGLLKSVVGVALLFSANQLSKLVRKESIV